MNIRIRRKILHRAAAMAALWMALHPADGWPEPSPLPPAPSNESRKKPDAVGHVVQTLSRWGQGAGSAAANASATALLTTTQTFSLLAAAAVSSTGILKAIPFSPLPPAGEKNSAAGAEPLKEKESIPAAYSAEESRVLCASCGQHTVIRGKLSGFIVRCPSCGNEITS